MFDKIKKLLKLDPFLGLCILCIIVLFVWGIYNIITNKKGRWSKNYALQTAQNVNDYRKPNKNS